MAHAWPPHDVTTTTTTTVAARAHLGAATAQAHDGNDHDDAPTTTTTTAAAAAASAGGGAIVAVVPVRVYSTHHGSYFDTELDEHAPLHALQRAIEAYFRIKCELQLLLHNRQPIDGHRSLCDNGAVLRKGEPFVKLVCGVKRGPLLNVLCRLPSRTLSSPRRRTRDGNNNNDDDGGGGVTRSRQGAHASPQQRRRRTASATGGADDAAAVVVLACHEQDTVFDVKRQLCAELNGGSSDHDLGDATTAGPRRRVRVARPECVRLLWRYVELSDRATLLEHRVPTNAELLVQWRREASRAVSRRPRRRHDNNNDNDDDDAAMAERVPEAARTVRRRPPSLRTRHAPLNYYAVTPFVRDDDDGGEAVVYNSDDEQQQQQHEQQPHAQPPHDTSTAFLYALPSTTSYVPVAGVGAPPPPPWHTHDGNDDNAHATSNSDHIEQPHYGDAPAATQHAPSPAANNNDDDDNAATTMAVAAGAGGLATLRETVWQLEAHVAELRARAAAQARSQHTRDATYAAHAARTAQRIGELEATVTRLHAYLQRALVLLA